jgi:5-methylcytosine-specific restriction endonuclease McrA
MKKFSFTQPKNQFVSDEALINDLKRVASELNISKLTMKLYAENGKYDTSTIIRRFGTWNNALRKIGLNPANVVNYSDAELYENILNIWLHKGKQPVRRDLALVPSKISQSAYSRRFQSWQHAIKSFVEYANRNDMSAYSVSNKACKSKTRTPRFPNLRLRWRVMKIDNFKCRGCGKSPATHHGIVLHIDHINPYSKGGETVIENLQTLCNQCNGGKSDLT